MATLVYPATSVVWLNSPSLSRRGTATRSHVVISDDTRIVGHQLNSLDTRVRISPKATTGWLHTVRAWMPSLRVRNLCLANPMLRMVNIKAGRTNTQTTRPTVDYLLLELVVVVLEATAVT